MKIASKFALAVALVVPAFMPTVGNAAPNSGKLALSGGIDYASNYYFRGYLQEDNGLLFQPYVGITAKLIDSDQFALSTTVGLWNSVHTEKTLSDGSNGSWYESDLTGSLDLTFGAKKEFTVSGIYTLYMYPNGAFESIQEFGAQLKYNDLGTIFEGFAFNPRVGIYFETDDGNGTEDVYGEVGITPGYTAKFGDGFELPLQFPITLGLSVDDYYVESNGDNDVFGYISGAVTTSIPLTFIPQDYGNWYLNLAGTYTYLISDSVEAANDDEQNVFTGKIGISFAY